MAIEEDPKSTFQTEGWLSGPEIGLNRCWICPCAPAKATSAFFGDIETPWNYHWGSVTNLRTASYSINAWLFFPALQRFSSEGEIIQPVSTPLLADGTCYIARPTAVDIPAVDLYTGYDGVNPSGFGLGMGCLNIPRHGNRPRTVPRNWPASAPLPGAVNVGFFDGHAQSVKLDALWQLYWHAAYVPPPKRPGLR